MSSMQLALLLLLRLLLRTRGLGAFRDSIMSPDDVDATFVYRYLLSDILLRVQFVRVVAHYRRPCERVYVVRGLVNGSRKS
jgi:hypothetical protein